MKIEKIELNVAKSNIKIYTSILSNVKNIKYLHFKYNDDDWYFKVSSIYIEPYEQSIKSTLVADCFGYYSDIEYLFNSVDDYSKLIGIELDVVTDQYEIDNLEDSSLLL